MLSTPRSADEDIFRPKDINAKGIDILSDAISQSTTSTSYEWNIKQGNEPRWFVDEFTSREGSSNVKSKKVFAVWANKATGEPVRRWKTKGGRPPVFQCVLPPGPVRTAYLSVADITSYEDSKIESAFQKVMFETDDESYDTEKFARYKAAIEHLNRFFNEDRLRFLAENLSKHDMLSEAERDIANEGTDALYKQLLLANNTKGNNTHHKCNVASAKRKIFRDGERRQGRFVPGICEPDKVTLKVLEDPNGDVRNYLEREDGAKRLNLYNIVLPDTTQLLPNEYHLFRPRGAIASLEVRQRVCICKSCTCTEKRVVEYRLRATACIVVWRAESHSNTRSCSVRRGYRSLVTARRA